MPLTIHYDPNLKKGFVDRMNNDSISAYWIRLSQTNYEELIDELEGYKGRLKLNDWGYHLLVFRTGEAIYGNAASSEAALFTWFVLAKSGYEVKIGYSSDNKVFLLLTSRNALYGVPYLTLERKRYYALTFDGQKKRPGALYTYKGKYPQADRSMNYAIARYPEFLKRVDRRNLSFSYQGETFRIPVKYNRTLVDFFEYYPQTDFPVYFNASASPEAADSLVAGLRPLVEGKTEGEAVNRILRFVQTAFEYKTDDAQFGREKYMLAEETLFYPYSDCEDRSVLFAYLVRILTGLDVIALHYPNHVATAVNFSDDIEGDYVIYDGRKYVICDPTYINAEIGMTMPEFRWTTPEIIPVEGGT